MKIEYVAFDSFGVKSSCIFIETNDVKILIDPGVSFETRSFPLSFPKRLLLTENYERKIQNKCKEAEIIIITHYHYDHHLPIREWYCNKILLIKDPNKNINKSQKNRANYFLSLIKDVVKEIKIADSKKFTFGKTKIKFSNALWHGYENTKLGYVVMCLVDEEFKLLHSSDIQGPIIEKYVKLILTLSPNILILDGAPTYLLGYLYGYRELAKAVLNLKSIVESKKIEKVILDHHLLRDYRYKELYYVAFEKAKESKIELKTAAEEINKEPAIVKYFKRNGPTKWKTWEKLTENKLKEFLYKNYKN